MQRQLSPKLTHTINVPHSKPGNNCTSGFCPGLLFSFGLCAGLRLSVGVVVLGAILLVVLVLLGPFAIGFLKALGRLVFALDFVPASALIDCDATNATEKGGER